MDPNIKALRDTVARKKAEALSIIHAAEAQGRNLTSDERTRVRACLDAGETAKLELVRLEGIGTKVDALAAGPGTGGLFDEFKAAGFPGKRAVIPARHLKAPSFFGDLDDLSPVRREGAELGFDKRYLADVFPSTPIGADVTSVQVMRQRSRTLPAPASVQRAIDATTAKAEVASVREMVQESVIQLAAVESDIPNILLAQDGIRSMVDQDLRLAILEAKDDAIVDAITAAAPAVAGAPGADLIEQVRYAIADMEADGYSPSVLALSPGDAADFDLTRTAGPESIFVFGPGAAAKPPFGQRVIASKSVADGEPLLIAPAQAGHRYEGPLSLERFEENDGSTNTSLVRLEQNFLFHVERVAAIRIVGAGS